MKRRLLRAILSNDRLVRLIPAGYRLTRSIPLGFRRYRSPRNIGFNQVLPVISGIGVGSVVKALMAPIAGKRRRRSPLVLPVVGGIGIGSVMMALLDPVAGKSRRARVRDGIASALENASARGITARYHDETVPSSEVGTESRRIDTEHWSPAKRVLSSLTGGALLAYGIGRRDWIGAALGVMGAGLFTRGATDKDLKSLIGLGAKPTSSVAQNYRK